LKPGGLTTYLFNVEMERLECALNWNGYQSDPGSLPTLLVTIVSVHALRLISRMRNETKTVNDASANDKY